MGPSPGCCDSRTGATPTRVVPWLNDWLETVGGSGRLVHPGNRVGFSRLDQGESSVDELDQLLISLDQPFLDGVDIDEQPRFQEWLSAERESVRCLRLEALRQLAVHRGLPPQRTLEVDRSWAVEEPFSRAAATHLLAMLQRVGESAEATRYASEYADRLRKAGVAWEPSADGPRTDSPETGARQLQARQKIQFCMAEDSVRIAYATVGEGPPIVKAANWLSHLGLDWDSPVLRNIALFHCSYPSLNTTSDGLSMPAQKPPCSW